jgi:hypothetical protein
MLKVTVPSPAAQSLPPERTKWQKIIAILFVKIEGNTDKHLPFYCIRANYSTEKIDRVEGEEGKTMGEKKRIEFSGMNAGRFKWGGGGADTIDLNYASFTNSRTSFKMYKKACRSILLLLKRQFSWLQRLSYE